MRNCDEAKSEALLVHCKYYWYIIIWYKYWNSVSRKIWGIIGTLLVTKIMCWIAILKMQTKTLKLEQNHNLASGYSRLDCYLKIIDGMTIYYNLI